MWIGNPVIFNIDLVYQYFSCFSTDKRWLCPICDFLKIWKKKEPEALEWIYLVVCASPVMTVFIVSFTTVESTGRYYFAFLIMLSMAVVLLFR